jgi:hypothetical protein
MQIMIILNVITLAHFADQNEHTSYKIKSLELIILKKTPQAQYKIFLSRYPQVRYNNVYETAIYKHVWTVSHLDKK